MKTHVQLVTELLRWYGGPQSKLAEELSAFRQDGREIIQNRVSRWSRGILPVTIEEAVCIQEYTRDRFLASDFHPCLNRIKGRNVRKLDSGKKRAAA